MVFAGTKRKMEELKANGSKITFIFHCSGFSIETYFRDSERIFLSFFFLNHYPFFFFFKHRQTSRENDTNKMAFSLGSVSYQKSLRNFQSLYETNPSNMKYPDRPR